MSPVTVGVETRGLVATVTLSNPAAGNRIDEAAAAVLREVCGRLASDDELRAVVVTGGGDVFCLGAEPGPSGGPAGDSGGMGALAVASAVAGIQVPVVAAINGDAIDQGLELALACDLRIASAGAKLGLTQIAAGLIPWDGGTQRLPRAVGPARATEMLLTARLVDVEEAFEIGLVNRVAAPGGALDEANAIADSIAAHGPIATRYLKEAVIEGTDLSLNQGMRLEADLNFLLQSTGDRAEGLASFRERRAPEYLGE